MISGSFLRYGEKPVFFMKDRLGFSGKLLRRGGSEKTAREIASIGFRSAFLRNASGRVLKSGKRIEFCWNFPDFKGER